jgi:Na+/melibiose symporter-like transporter
MTDYTENFTFNFILFGSMSTISLLLTFVAIPSQRHDLAKNKKQKENKQEKLSKLCRVLRKPFMIAFLLELFVLGCCVGVVERLLFVYLQNELHGNTTLCGLTVGVTVIIEFPMFHYNQKIAQRLGHHGMMMTALLAYSIRSFGYTLLTTETRYYILFLEALHGVTFALLWSAAVEYGKIHAPKDFNTTMQSIITTVYSALGVGIGSLVGGHIMDQYGGRWMYRGSSALSIIVFAIHAVVLFFSKCFGDNLGSTKEEEQQPTTTTTSSSIYSPLINDNNADTAIINDDD